MFSYCADFSYYRPIPMAMPFGTFCCHGSRGNSFLRSFMTSFMLSSGGVPTYTNPYYSIPSFSSFSVPQNPILNVPEFNFSMPDLYTPLTTPSATYSPFANYFSISENVASSRGTNLSLSSYTASTSEAFNPFNAFSEKSATDDKKVTGSRFDSNKYMTFNTSVKNLPQLSAVGYNSTKGETLAREVLSKANGFSHMCGTRTREALERAGLDNGKRTGSAADFGDVLLGSNKNFKEISTDGINLSSLPAGCVLVYGRGVAGYDSEHGHVEITLGDGRAASDGITHNIRKGARVFVPV